MMVIVHMFYKVILIEYTPTAIDFHSKHVSQGQWIPTLMFGILKLELKKKKY